MSLHPSSVTVRMYNVGFGDSFLLSFAYPRDRTRPERHVLVDCGSTKHAPTVTLRTVVDDVVARSDGKLDVLVVTHRHADHLSAFGDARLGPRLAALAPEVVLRPWVDNPAAPWDADEPTAAFVGSIRSAQSFAAQLAGAIRTVRGPRPGPEPALLAAAAAQQSNAAAITRLDMLSRAGRGRYLHATPAPLTLAALPGVTLRILGPPTYRQLPEARSEAANYKDEYWLAQTTLLRDALTVAGLTSRQAKLLARAALEADNPDTIIGPASWLIARMQDRHEQALARLVEGIDKALNNTSLILLVEAGTKKLLLPGDAQGENWSWSLEHADRRSRTAWAALLADVDLYKVGHHGSRNATPKPLYQLWADRGRDLVSIMSTLPGKHGDPSAKTEVPRKTLVTALRGIGPLYRTDGQRAPYLELTAPLTNHQPFTALT